MTDTNAAAQREESPVSREETATPSPAGDEGVPTLTEVVEASPTAVPLSLPEDLAALASTLEARVLEQLAPSLARAETRAFEALAAAHATFREEITAAVRRATREAVAVAARGK